MWSSLHHHFFVDVLFKDVAPVEKRSLYCSKPERKWVQSCFSLWSQSEKESSASLEKFCGTSGNKKKVTRFFVIACLLSRSYNLNSHSCFWVYLATLLFLFCSLLFLCISIRTGATFPSSSTAENNLEKVDCCSASQTVWWHFFRAFGCAARRSWWLPILYPHNRPNQRLHSKLVCASFSRSSDMLDSWTLCQMRHHTGKRIQQTELPGSSIINIDWWDSKWLRKKTLNCPSSRFFFFLVFFSQLMFALVAARWVGGTIS